MLMVISIIVCFLKKHELPLRFVVWFIYACFFHYTYFLHYTLHWSWRTWYRFGCQKTNESL